MEEQQWISQAAQGDTQAFAHLVERYETVVYHQALRLVGNREDAADVTQEVFWKAWRALPTFRGESSFSTWLYRLTDNACLDLLRREDAPGTHRFMTTDNVLRFIRTGSLFLGHPLKSAEVSLVDLS